MKTTIAKTAIIALLFSALAGFATGLDPGHTFNDIDGSFIYPTGTVGVLNGFSFIMWPDKLGSVNTEDAAIVFSDFQYIWINGILSVPDELRVGTATQWNDPQPRLSKITLVENGLFTIMNADSTEPVYTFFRNANDTAADHQGALVTKADEWTGLGSGIDATQEPPLKVYRGTTGTVAAEGDLEVNGKIKFGTDQFYIRSAKRTTSSGAITAYAYCDAGDLRTACDGYASVAKADLSGDICTFYLGSYPLDDSEGCGARIYENCSAFFGSSEVTAYVYCMDIT